MKKTMISKLLGIILILCGIFFFFNHIGIAGIIQVGIGASLLIIGFKPGRTGMIIFGHMCILIGCILLTWGIYLLPYSEPKLLHIFTRPLFWGLFSIFGGICAIYHGFCRCVRSHYDDGVNVKT
jgi:hypothetical protein